VANDIVILSIERSGNLVRRPSEPTQSVGE
jgi:hypothetical protein